MRFIPLCVGLDHKEQSLSMHQMDPVEDLGSPYGKQKKLVAHQKMTAATYFLPTIFENIFSGQRGWGRSIVAINRKHNDLDESFKRKQLWTTGPFFICNELGCSLRQCKQPRNYERIRANLDL